MEYLDIGEKRYVKVSSAARETGYTTDYIGQLCRAKKIDAKLVGRTWYVAHSELLAHRQTRGRSSHEKAKKAFKKEIAVAEGETRIPITIEHSGVRKRLISEHITYHTDEVELIPNARTPQIPAKEKQEQKITVQKDSKEHQVDFNKEEKPEIKWNGTIVIKSLNDIEEDEIASKNQDKTTPLTRHMAIRNTERATAVPLSASTGTEDPLLQRERFLSRINRAHDLNTLQAAVHTTASAHPIKKPVPAEAKREGDASSAMSRIVSWLHTLSWAGVVTVGLIIISSFFLQKSLIFSMDSTTHDSTPSFQKSLTIGSLMEAKNNTVSTISTIRDMFKNKL